MTFEQYLTENCELRMLENLMDMGPDAGNCTFPGKLWEDKIGSRMQIHEKGTFCMPAGIHVERVYYRIKDAITPPAGRMDQAAAKENGGAEDSCDLAFLISFAVEFAVAANGENQCAVSAETRKYYAECRADIDDGAVRNFRMNSIFDSNTLTDLDIEMRRKQGEFSRYPVKALTNEELEARAQSFLERYCHEALEEPMRVPVRTIFRREFAMKLECGSDEQRFTMTREGCRRLWDSTALKLLEILDENDADPPYPEAMYKIMEKNAKRTAAGILMPAATLKPVVWGFLGAYEKELQGEEAGNLLKNMVFTLAEDYEVSVQAMKIRLEDLGFAMFGGVLNHLDGEYVPAFTTSEESPARCGRYLIGMSQLKGLLLERPELLKLCEQEKLVYIEGKLVMNQCEYVQVEAGERIMTPYARSHVDECCIRFRGMSGQGRKPAAPGAVIYELGSNRRLRGSMRGGGCR